MSSVEQRAEKQGDPIFILGEEYCPFNINDWVFDRLMKGDQKEVVTNFVLDTHEFPDVPLHAALRPHRSDKNLTRPDRVAFTIGSKKERLQKANLLTKKRKISSLGQTNRYEEEDVFYEAYIKSLSKLSIDVSLPIYSLDNVYYGECDKEVLEKGNILINKFIHPLHDLEALPLIQPISQLDIMRDIGITFKYKKEPIPDVFQKTIYSFEKE